MKLIKKHYRIYTATTSDGKSWEIDGQDSNTWALYQMIDTGYGVEDRSFEESYQTLKQVKTYLIN